MANTEQPEIEYVRESLPLDDPRFKDFAAIFERFLPPEELTKKVRSWIPFLLPSF
jgi:hypothetical protein